MLAEMAPGVEIVFYGRPLCDDCDAAKEVITEVGAPYKYRNVKTEPEARLDMANICRALGREPAVPIIVIRHKTDEVDGQIVFIEPRGFGLRALAGTLLSFVRK